MVKSLAKLLKRKRVKKDKSGDTNTTLKSKNELKKIPEKTKPTGEMGGSPSGERTPETGSQKHKHKRENESADLLAQNGYKIKQNPDTLPNGKNPDFEIEGKVFDNLAPDSSNIDQIRKGISNKVNSGQTERIVLNLDDSPFNPSDISDLLTRKPKEGLLEVIGIKNGEITQIFP